MKQKVEKRKRKKENKEKKNKVLEYEARVL